MFTLLIAAVVGTALMAWIARTQARAMFRFVTKDEAQRTERPEHLSMLEKAAVIAGGVTVPRPQNTTDPAAEGLAFETFAVDNERGDTLEIWRIPAPAGPTKKAEAASSDTAPVPAPRVLMFHGYAASKESLLPAAKQFHQLGCECWLVDFFGSGGSSGSHTTFGWFEANDVDAVVRDARQRHPDSRRALVLFGSSMGGSAVMRALADLGTPADGALVESVFHDLRGTVAKRFHLMKLPAFPAADILLYFGGRDLGFDASRHCPLDYAQRIETPTLFLHGSHDTRAPATRVEEMRDAMAGPASLVEFDAGHQTLARSHPHAWREVVRLFFQQYATAP